jgi:hypothetical protein
VVVAGHHSRSFTRLLFCRIFRFFGVQNNFGQKIKKNFLLTKKFGRTAFLKDFSFPEHPRAKQQQRSRQFFWLGVHRAFRLPGNVLFMAVHKFYPYQWLSGDCTATSPRNELALTAAVPRRKLWPPGHCSGLIY